MQNAGFVDHCQYSLQPVGFATFTTQAQALQVKEALNVSAPLLLNSGNKELTKVHVITAVPCKWAICSAES